MKQNSITLGTRGSDLALWQAHWVQEALLRLHKGLQVDIKIIKTTGDKILDTPLAKIGDKGLFTREIEHALLEGTIDLAVHSLKDLPTELPAGLTIGAVTEREDPRDVFLPHPRNPVRTLREQGQGARIATGSLRRKCQLLSSRPDLDIVDLRGNLVTRFKKLEESNWQGMVLARAGVVRLGWIDRVGEVIDASVLLPAVGQGALGIEIRQGDARVQDIIAGLIHLPTLQATTAERALLRRLEGGCQVPIGTFGRIEADGRLVLDAVVGSLDGRTVIRVQEHGAAADAERVGRQAAESLLARGADAILRGIRMTTADDDKPDA